MHKVPVWRLWCPLKTCIGKNVYGRCCKNVSECLGGKPDLVFLEILRPEDQTQCVAELPKKKKRAHV